MEYLLAASLGVSIVTGIAGTAFGMKSQKKQNAIAEEALRLQAEELRRQQLQ